MIKTLSGRVHVGNLVPPIPLLGKGAVPAAQDIPLIL